MTLLSCFDYIGIDGELIVFSGVEMYITKPSPYTFA